MKDIPTQIETNVTLPNGQRFTLRYLLDSTEHQRNLPEEYIAKQIADECGSQIFSSVKKELRRQRKHASTHSEQVGVHGGGMAGHDQD